jgi:5-(carboxyamino)imidazole ribonucleotide mutase
MPPGIPVATVAVNGAQNAGILAVQMIALGDSELAGKLETFKETLKSKIEKANNDLAQIKFRYKTN